MTPSPRHPRYFFDHLPEVVRKLRRSDSFLLMLDFDGTLAPIVSTPDRAAMPRDVTRELRACARRFPVAVVSGRSLADIKAKVGIRGLIYAGNHGLEWQIGGKKVVSSDAAAGIPLIADMARALTPLPQEYRGVVIENKRLTMAIHYRNLAPARVAALKGAVATIVSPFIGRGRMILSLDKKTIELRPDVQWNKGAFARFLHRTCEQTAGRSLTPIYIGDSATDEDAFAALKGVTIRVGKSATTRAAYYLRNAEQSILFLRWLRHWDAHR